MHSDDLAIAVNEVTKSYRLFVHSGERVKQFLSLGFRTYHRQFTALRDVTFVVRKGETVGIIGRNGAGKSTLLQLICGILKPTAGTVVVNGRISALLELGSGFNPEFTGRENVYFQGMLMGFAKAEVDTRFDDIAAFAGIGDFIEQPVRTYSSGMFVRLAFAVAISFDPDILVVDEALAVGDAEFQAKCLKRIDSIRKRGGTIIIVSHALEQVAHHCDRVLMLDEGRLIADGDVASTLETYINHTRATRPDEYAPEAGTATLAGATESFSLNPNYSAMETRWGDRKATIESIRVTQSGCDDPQSIVPALPVEVHMSVRFHARIDRPIYGLSLKSEEGAMLLTVNSRDLGGNAGFRMQQAGDLISVRFKFEPYLDEGEYKVSVGVASETPEGIAAHDRRYDSLLLRVAAPRKPSGEIAMNASFERCAEA